MTSWEKVAKFIINRPNVDMQHKLQAKKRRINCHQRKWLEAFVNIGVSIVKSPKEI